MKTTSQLDFHVCSNLTSTLKAHLESGSSCSVVAVVVYLDLVERESICLWMLQVESSKRGRREARFYSCRGNERRSDNDNAAYNCSSRRARRRRLQFWDSSSSLQTQEPIQVSLIQG